MNKDTVYYGLTDKFNIIKIENLKAKDVQDIKYMVLDTNNKVFLPIELSEMYKYGTLSSDSITTDPKSVIDIISQLREKFEKKEEAFLSSIFLAD